MAETVFGMNNFPIFVAMKGISNTYFLKDYSDIFLTIRFY